MVKLIHICEVCEIQENLEPEVAFDAGWDYPPKMYPFRIVSPRTCPDCPIDKTVWWDLVVNEKNENELTSKQRATLKRIAEEPESILIEEPSA